MAPHLFVPKDLCPHPLSSYVGNYYGSVIIEPYCANCLTYILLLTLYHNTSTTRIRTKGIIAALQFCSSKETLCKVPVYILSPSRIPIQTVLLIFEHVYLHTLTTK